MQVAPDSGVSEYGCQHYKRRAQLVAPCCGETFWCRHCHNVAKNDNEQDPNKRHVLDRKLVAEVVCALCSTRQPAAPACSTCGVQFGRYTCMECRFFDDTIEKEQFHCDACGICRVGGRQNFFHCQTCACCYNNSLLGNHVCVERSMHQNCCVCMEWLFDSTRQITVMPCGHTIHQDCLPGVNEHQTFTCPTCSKSYLNPESMQHLWEQMDHIVESNPLPPAYDSIRVSILCNECGTHSSTSFHAAGHKCSHCGAYNTRRI